MLNFYTDESEDESDSAFEKFVEQFRTPLSKPVSYTIESEDASDSEFEKSINQYRTPLTKSLSYRNESEDASDSEFEKFIEQYRTPLTKPMSYRNEPEDASDSEFENFIHQYRTPLTKCIGKYESETHESEDDETEFCKFTERVTEKIHSSDVILHFVQDSRSSPGLPEKQKLTYSSKGDSEDDCVSVNVEESTQSILQSQTVGEHHDEKDASSGMHCVSSIIISSDSEDEESEFLKFSERIRQTPQIQNIVHVPKSVTNDPSDDKDDDEVFLKFSENFRKLCTPKSQNRNNARHSIVSNNFPEKQGSFHSSNESSRDLISSGDKPVQNSVEVLQTRNKEEFTALFPTVSQTSETFCRKRQKYAEQLFGFFNKKIFDSQLPKDIPLIWDNSLIKAAGLTCCSRKNGVYTCSIKLSSKLLTSFERLQDTLLHEMCHAAVWIINKIESVNHGPLWQIWGSRCKMILPFIECPEKCHTYDVPYSIWYQCFTCNWKKGRFRQSQRLANSVCKKCRKPVIVTRT